MWRLFYVSLIWLLISSAASAQSSAPAAKYDPNAILRSAKTVLVRSKSAFFKSSALENKLTNNAEFRNWGMVVTKDLLDADLIIEIGRKAFTTSFIYNVIDPKTNRVVASGKVNSIGGTVEDKISNSFIKKLRSARAASVQ